MVIIQSVLIGIYHIPMHGKYQCYRHTTGHAGIIVIDCMGFVRTDYIEKPTRVLK